MSSGEPICKDTAGEPRTSRKAVISLVLALVSAVAAMPESSYLFVQQPLHQGHIVRPSYAEEAALCGLPLALAGFILGGIATYQILRSGGRLCGYGMAFFGLTISGAAFILITVAMVYSTMSLVGQLGPPG
jgi:hypothetical protein